MVPLLEASPLLEAFAKGTRFHLSFFSYVRMSYLGFSLNLNVMAVCGASEWQGVFQVYLIYSLQTTCLFLLGQNDRIQRLCVLVLTNICHGQGKKISCAKSSIHLSSNFRGLFWTILALCDFLLRQSTRVYPF